jgi:hypothetical protein
VDNIVFLNNYVVENQCSLLGIGPMSKNCVDVVIDLVNTHNIPIMLIASRRQIESKSLGHGYVNNWSTEEFSKYVNENDRNNNVILCRDHGGPYQNENENKQNLSFNEITNKAKESFRTDIKSDFKIIHIDPSENLISDLTLDEILNRIYDLYDFCYSVADEYKKQIFIEISIGKEDGGISNFSEIKYVIEKMENFCKLKNLPLPLFMVIKTGNHVLETENIGILEEIVDGKDSEEKTEIIKMIDYCNTKKIMIKEHNGDYLSNYALQQHPKLGIHAINVAPEFGVTETRSILSWLDKNNLNKFKDEFLEICYNSKKWEKWIMPNSTATQNDKSIIAGHYIYSTPEFLNLKKRILECIENPDDFDNYLKREIKKSILRYLENIGMIKHSVDV